MTVRLARAKVTQLSPSRIVMRGDRSQTPIPALPKVYGGKVGDLVSVRVQRAGLPPQIVALIQAGP